MSRCLSQYNYSEDKHTAQRVKQYHTRHEVIGGIFVQCMGTMPTHNREEFGYLLICSGIQV